MKKIALLAVVPILAFAEMDFERPTFREFKEDNTLVLENIEHSMKDLRNDFATLSAFIIEIRRSNELLEDINQKLTLVVEDNLKTIYALETISWNQEHRIDAKPPKRGP